MSQTTNYNDADAAAFVHKATAEALGKFYQLEDIACILDLVYEYYESIEDEMISDPNKTVDIGSMGSFINEQLKELKMRELAPVDLEGILIADNEYMDSIGVVDDNVVDLDVLMDELYAKLPAELQKKYSEDEVYTILCFEADYHDANEYVDVDDMLSYILSRAEKEALSIDTDTLMTILKLESKLLGEEGFYED